MEFGDEATDANDASNSGDQGNEAIEECSALEGKIKAKLTWLFGEHGVLRL